MQTVLAMSHVNDQIFTMLRIYENISSSIRCERIRSILIIDVFIFIVHWERMFKPRCPSVIIRILRRVNKLYCYCSNY